MAMNEYNIGQKLIYCGMEVEIEFEHGRGRDNKFILYGIKLLNKKDWEDFGGEEYIWASNIDLDYSEEQGRDVLDN